MQQPDLLSIISPCTIAFELQLADGSILTISEIVRVVPNKRLVCKGFLNGKQGKNENVYAKIFLGANAKRYASRDKQGVQALINAKINTPQLLFAGLIKTDQTLIGEALIFSAISSAQNAEDLYLQLFTQQQSTSRLQLMLQLTGIVAQMHNVNLHQTDLYFKNFLIAADKVYAIDGDGIKVFFPFCKKTQKRRNLAMLLSKMDGLDTGWVEDIYQHYCEQTNTKFDAFEYAQVCVLTQKYRQQSANDYADKKVFRTCTDVTVNRNFKKFVAFSPDFDAQNLTQYQLDLALKDTQNRLKSGNTCTVGSALIDSQQVVIKRYNIKNFWHGLKLNFSQSRAAKSWANAHRLMLLNVATAKPLALVETRFGWFKKRAYFLTQFIDAPDIATFLEQETDVLIKEKVAFATAQLFYKLNLLNISHGDCKASNIKIVDNKPVLIDLDSMQVHDVGGFFGNYRHEKKHIKDLQRFIQNWENAPDIRAIFSQAFLQAYDEVDDCLHISVLERAKIV